MHRRFRLRLTVSGASLLKILFWDGTGLCLFTKRMDHGNFWWPRAAEPGGSVTLTLAMLIEGIDWRAPERWCDG
jgi:transposase